MRPRLGPPPTSARQAGLRVPFLTSSRGASEAQVAVGFARAPRSGSFSLDLELGLGHPMAVPLPPVVAEPLGPPTPCGGTYCLGRGHSVP